MVYHPSPQQSIKQQFIPKSFLGGLLALLASLLISPKLYSVCRDFLIATMQENYSYSWAIVLGDWLFYLASFPLVAFALYAICLNLWRVIYLKIITRLI